MVRCCLCAMLSLGLLISSVPVLSAAEGWTPELMLQVRRIGQVRPSPDGRRVAYTVAEPVMTEDRSEFVTQIWMAVADGSQAMPMTFAAKSSTNPVWSPDGQFLAFISDRSGKSNLFRLRVAGGEAEQLTEVKSNIGAFAWSPDSKQIAFVMADPPSDADDKSAKAKDDARWIDREFKMDRLYLLSVEKGHACNARPTTDVDRLVGRQRAVVFPGDSRHAASLVGDDCGIWQDRRAVFRQRVAAVV